MNPLGFSWAGLMGMQPQRIHQTAWFVYGWVEREHVLNLTACTDWWIRAIGLSAAQLNAPRHGNGTTVPPVASVLPHDDERA
jgi:hypothetical protein